MTIATADFLLELRSEEIPARMQAQARVDLERLFTEACNLGGLAVGKVETFSTPRRLALIARDLPMTTAAVSEERKGPRADAPSAAIEGFLRAVGMTHDQLERRDDGRGGTVLFAVVERPGRAAGEVLAGAIRAVINGFPWPKSMRWGTASISTAALRWVRPLHGIVALLGDSVVEVEIAGICSGAATLGHRVHHPGVITIGSAGDYLEKLRACHVIVDQEARATIIDERAHALAADAGLDLIADRGLVIENAGLTEWPVPLLGSFDAAFLDVPAEVIQLTARVNQKYFVCRDAGGALANAFVCTANLDAADGGTMIVAGHVRVIAARLADARFFWNADRSIPLDDRVARLARIVFHDRLGSVAAKVDRIAALARWLVETKIIAPRPDDATATGTSVEIILADRAERAARLAKTDLVSAMVGEFPELQGAMGRYYALAQGEDVEVADAIRDHYLPVGVDDAVPEAPVTIAVALADRIDTLAGFFLRGMPPTGSKDPFALRRAAIGCIALIVSNELRLPLTTLIGQALAGYGETLPHREAVEDGEVPVVRADSGERAEATTALLGFFGDRLKVRQRSAGLRHDLIDAVFALGSEDDLVRLLARVAALDAFVTSEAGHNLLAGYKRAANILKKAAAGVDAAPPPAAVRVGLGEAAEQALTDALDVAEPASRQAVVREDFAGALLELAPLRSAVDRFFEDVTVNDPDRDVRAARLSLLARFCAAVHNVADFSRIEG